MRRLLGLGLLAALAVALLALSAAPALGNHVHCGDTITQDTRLDSDLVNCPSDGIVVGAGSITLDLNRHTIDGDGIPTDPDLSDDDGIGNQAGYDDIVVKGGVVQDFDYGIRFTPNSPNLTVNNRIFGLTTSHNGTGIELGNAQANRIHDNLISDNAVGLDLGFGSHGNHVTNNSLLSSVSAVVIEEANDNRVRRNSVIGVTFSGIVIAGGEHNLIEGNAVSGGPQSEWSRGIVLMDADHNTVRHNLVSESDRGVLLISFLFQDGSDGNRIEGNLVRRNHNEGIRVSFELGPNDGPSDSNHIVGNRTSDNGQDGIFVEADNVGNVLERNVSKGNGDDGIDIDNSETTLSRNTANFNLDYGIEAVPGVVDGGGNRAFGNGNPLQCLNVACR